MRLPHLKFVIAAMAAFGALAFAPPPAAAQYDAEVDVSVFYDELDEGGDWFEHPEWGYVWRPPVRADWRPYTRGRWIYTDDYGWFWDSQEPWAWAVYHYGRWAYDDYAGWIWIPGRHWGPAWVAWRYGDDNIGWAPLPPQSVWRPSVGIVFNVDFFGAAVYDPYWVFVAPRYFAYDRVYRYARPHRYNRSIIRQTRRSTRYGYHQHRVVNRGIDPHTYRRLTHRSPPRRELVVHTNRYPKGYGNPHQRNQVELYRPGKRNAGYHQRKAPRKVSTGKWGFGGPPNRSAAPGGYKPGQRSSPYANPSKGPGSGTTGRNTKYNNAPPNSGTRDWQRNQGQQFQDVDNGRRYDGASKSNSGNAYKSNNRNGRPNADNTRGGPDPYRMKSDRQRSPNAKNFERNRGPNTQGSERRRTAKPGNENGNRNYGSNGGNGGDRRQAKNRDGNWDKKREND